MNYELLVSDWKTYPPFGGEMNQPMIYTNNQKMEYMTIYSENDTEAKKKAESFIGKRCAYLALYNTKSGECFTKESRWSFIDQRSAYMKLWRPWN